MDRPQTSSPSSWEYMVIHLNVEPGPSQPTPGSATAGGGGSAEEAGATARPVFSESFLKKEFPQFYDSRQAPGHPAQPQHPAQQLQNFLNGHGARGWELIGLFPVGALSMLFFRRPCSAAPSGEVRPHSSAAESGTGTRGGPPQHSADLPADDRGAEPNTLLAGILARLTALEQGQASQSPAPIAREVPGQAPPPLQTSNGQPLPIEPELVIHDSLLQRLAAETPMPSSAAAQAIGLRSAASLANLGARHGFRRGLCKRGPNGQVAIYVGSGASEHGGRARRLWIVVPAERLQD